MPRSNFGKRKMVTKKSLKVMRRFFNGLDYALLVAEHGARSREVQEYLKRNPSAENDKRFIRNVLGDIFKNNSE